jgi:hypothetical protein
MARNSRILDIFSSASIIYGTLRERMYRWRSLSARDSKYQQVGNRRNHLGRLSLISIFRQKLDNLYLLA